MYSTAFGWGPKSTLCDTHRFRDRMDLVDEFVKAQNIPDKLADDMRKNLNHSWYMQQGIDVNSVLEELPENLRTTVLMHMQVEDAYDTNTTA